MNTENKINLKSKTYECKNFEYPYIQINNINNGSKYILNFLNTSKDSMKTLTFKDNVPNCLLKLFDMNLNETNKGLITEITCINSYNI